MHKQICRLTFYKKGFAYDHILCAVDDNGVTEFYSLLTGGNDLPDEIIPISFKKAQQLAKNQLLVGMSEDELSNCFSEGLLC